MGYDDRERKPQVYDYHTSFEKFRQCGPLDRWSQLLDVPKKRRFVAPTGIFRHIRVAASLRCSL
jgi:hypothetical protein